MGIRILKEDYSTAAAVAVAQVRAHHIARHLHTSSLLAGKRGSESGGERFSGLEGFTVQGLGC